MKCIIKGNRLKTLHIWFEEYREEMVDTDVDTVVIHANPNPIKGRKFVKNEEFLSLISDLTDLDTLKKNVKKNQRYNLK